MTTKPIRKFNATRIALLFSFLLGGCNGAFKPPEPAYFEASLQADDGPMSPVRLRMPHGYANDLVGWWMPHMPKTQPELTKAALLVLATWPDLDPKTAKNRKEFSNPRGATMQILISPRSYLKDAATFERSMQWLYKFKKEWNAVTSEGDRLGLLVSYPSRYGLNVVGMPPALMNDTYRDGVTLRKFDMVMVPKDETSSPGVVITCTADHIPEPEAVANASRIPMCSMYFPNPMLQAIVDVSFRRMHLSDWRDIQHRVTSLLDSFIVRNSK